MGAEKVAVYLRTANFLVTFALSYNVFRIKEFFYINENIRIS